MEPTKSKLHISTINRNLTEVENNLLQKKQEESSKMASLEIELQEMSPVERELTMTSWKRKLTGAESFLLSKERKTRKHRLRIRNYRRKKKLTEPKKQKNYSANPAAVRKREYRERQEQLKKYGEETESRLVQTDDNKSIKTGSLEYQLARASQERQLTNTEIDTLAKERKKRKNREKIKRWRDKKADEQQIEDRCEGYEVCDDNMDYIIKTEEPEEWLENEGSVEHSEAVEETEWQR